MQLPQPLIPGTLQRRYKRFLADIVLTNGETITAHCPNSGSLKGCDTPGNPVLISRSSNPKRKLPYTWELVQVNGVWVGINTIYPNRLVREAIENGTIVELQGYTTLRGEVPIGEHSRIDLLAERPGEQCWIEVKNVTLVEDGVALFPDAVTTRGQKHLQELMTVKAQGARAVIFFVVQRADGRIFAPADNIDPEYGRLLRKAHRAGVEILPYLARVTPESITLSHRIPFQL